MDIQRTQPDTVTIQFSYDEALVLSDLLQRWDNNGWNTPPPIGHPADQRILDDLCASFEPIIDEVFADDYAQIVAAAQTRFAAPQT